MLILSSVDPEGKFQNIPMEVTENELVAMVEWFEEHGYYNIRVVEGSENQV